VVGLIQVLHLKEPAPVEDPEICRDKLRKLCKRLEAADSGPPVEALLRYGRADEEILRSAEETGCDLLVLGTHGRTALGRLLMGSIAEQVLRHAGCAVLLIKAAVRTSSHGAPAPN
jgi:nucleotide-binding universal stress UspA family protein